MGKRMDWYSSFCKSSYANMSIGHMWGLDNLCYYKYLQTQSTSLIRSGIHFTCILSSCSTISVPKLRFRRCHAPQLQQDFHKIPKGQTEENMAGKTYLESYILVTQGSVSDWKVEVMDIPQRSGLLHIKY